MNITNYFNLSRFWQLLKMELFRSRRGVLMTLVITIGLLLVGLLTFTITEDSKVFDSHPENYTFTLLLGGFILSSLAFRDLANDLKRHNYLMLPVSSFEKFVSMWLLTSLGWVALFSVVYFFYTLIANEIGHLLFSDITYPEFDPLSIHAIQSIKYYIVLQGIFLLGAVRFKGYAFPKTLFTLVLFGMLFGIITYYIMVDLFLSEHECTTGYDCEIVAKMQLHQIWIITLWVFWWGLAPLCWVLTYMGLKEQEV